MNCSFIFGKDNTTVKRMDTSILKVSYDLPNRYLGKTPWYHQPGLLKKIKNYDVIINDLGIYCITSWVFMILAKFRHQKVYNWDHGYYGKESKIKTYIKRLYFGLATGSFIYGEYAITLMAKNGFNATKLFPIHNSLDYESQLALRNTIKPSYIYQEYFGNTNPVLIMIGRLNLRKKLNQLIEAVALLKNKGQIYNVVLVGDGEDRKSIEELVAKLDIQKQVWFYGACYDEATNADLIFNADMCVVPGDIGLTAIHCMMFGVPVITHNYFPNQGPEFEVIKEGYTGSFFKHDDISSLAEVISTWFANHIKDREATRKSCFKEIDEKWTPKYQIDVLKKVIYS